jgi:hypothetical protein
MQTYYLLYVGFADVVRVFGFDTVFVTDVKTADVLNWWISTTANTTT